MRVHLFTVSGRVYYRDNPLIMKKHEIERDASAYDKDIRDQFLIRKIRYVIWI